MFAPGTLAPRAGDGRRPPPAQGLPPGDGRRVGSRPEVVVMRRLIVAVVVVCALLAAPATAGARPGSAAVGNDSRTLVFRLRVKGLVAQAVWTTCPAPADGDLCTDTIIFGFDTKDRENKDRSRTPVLRILTFVYRFVEDPEAPSAPIAEWFGRLEGADVSGDPRLDHAIAHGVVPIQVCTIFDPSSGLTCPDSLDVSARWTGVGERQRVADHTVVHQQFRMENSWTRGWQRTATATATVDGAPVPGVLVFGELSRIDQGEIVVQHPIE